MFRVPRLRQIPHAERGAIAILAGVMVAVLVSLAVVMAEIGLQALQRFEMHDASEAMAMANGFQVLSQPSPGFGGAIPTEPLVPDNARAFTDASPTLLAVPTMDGATPSWNVSAGSYAMVNGPTTHMLSGAILGSSGGDFVPMAVVGGNARVAVNQFQLAQYKIIPARIVLVVDFSRSMRLTFAGGTTPADAAINVMKNALLEIVNDPALANRVNWGFVPFSDTVGVSSEIGLVPAASWTTNPAALITQVGTLTTQIPPMPTFGNGTDLAGAIAAAITMLNGSGAANSAYNGKGVIIILTDGEPDTYAGATPGTPYATLVQTAAQLAQQQVYAAWAAGYQTMSVLINRETTLPATEDQQFMASLGGDTNGAGGGTQISGYSTIASAGGDITDWLGQINPANHCISAQAITPPAGSWMPPPVNTDLMYGYWVKSGTPLTNETVVTRVFSTNNMDTTGPGSAGVTMSAPTFFFDPNTNLIEVSYAVCADYIAHPAAPPKFRIRWGLPRLASVGTL